MCSMSSGEMCGAVWQASPGQPPGNSLKDGIKLSRGFEHEEERRACSFSLSYWNCHDFTMSDPVRPAQGSSRTGHGLP